MTAQTFVAVGTASTSDGGTAPTPAMPTGVAVGDRMLAVFYTRNITTGAVQISTGWNPLVSDMSAGGLLAVFTRVMEPGDLAPTFKLFNLASGAAGDDCLAQVGAWRNSGEASLLGMVRTNAAATNIGPLSECVLSPRSAIVVIGAKRDDYTSVAALSGNGLTWSELAEVKSTAGADAGLIWDAAINGDIETTVTAKTFAVTGGTSVAGKICAIQLASLDDSTIHWRRRGGK